MKTLQRQLLVGQEDVRLAHAGAGLGVIRGSADILSPQFVAPGDALDVTTALRCFGAEVMRDVRQAVSSPGSTKGRNTAWCP